MLTVLFAVNLVLCTLLIFVPYSLFHAYSAYVYEATHDYGLDPTNWFPFAWEGFGRVLYQMSISVWWFAAYVVTPLIAIQVAMIYRNWSGLTRAEKILHPALLVVTILLASFMLTAGQAILYWLQD